VKVGVAAAVVVAAVVKALSEPIVQQVLHLQTANRQLAML